MRELECPVDESWRGWVVGVGGLRGGEWRGHSDRDGSWRCWEMRV